MKNKYLVLIIILIFIISIAVRYYPLLHKGYPFNVSATNLVLARNLALTGEYKLDNEKNVVLSSEIIKEEGIQSNLGNKLTPVLYGKLFSFSGFNQDFPLYVSLILYGLVSVLFFFLIFKLFNIWVALIFSFIDVFSPLILQYAVEPALYEWAVLFLAIGLFIYLYKQKPNLFRLLLAGLFFGLASLARNSFVLSFVPFLVYDFWKTRSFKRLAIFILPFIILWGIYLGPGLMKEGGIENAYLSFKETTSRYMHAFPDPYTWHFERDAYAESIRDTANYTYNEYLIRYGYPVSLKNKILMYWSSIVSYPKGLVAQTTIGGPFLVFLLVLGGFYLYRKKKEILKLFILWAVLLYIFLIINKSNHWDHFIVLELPLFLLISLGIYWAFQFISKQSFKNIFKYLLIFGFIITLFLHLIQSDRWTLHERYNASNIEKVLILVDSIEDKRQEIDRRTDVIAVGLYNQAPTVLNWYTDFSFIYFSPNTIKKLLKQEKLKWAFEQFKITKIIGYDRDLTEQILEATDLEAI